MWGTHTLEFFTSGTAVRKIAAGNGSPPQLCYRCHAFLPREGLVDPSDEQQVAAVLSTVLRVLGIPGIGDLLGRMPGSRVEASRGGGMFTRAVPACVWLSPQHQILLSDPVVHVHVVGGVVLAR